MMTAAELEAIRLTARIKGLRILARETRGLGYVEYVARTKLAETIYRLRVCQYDASVQQDGVFV